MKPERSKVLRIFSSFPFLLGVSVLICTLTYFLFDTFYLYGDDYLMNYFANGSFGETYSAHLIFIRYPLGLALSALFRALPSINWYAGLLIGSMALSFGVFHFAVLKTEKPLLGLFFTLLANTAAVPLFLTFTVSGFLTAAAGLIVALLTLRNNGSSIKFLPAILLLTLSYMLRNDCLLPVCGLAFPVFLKLLFPDEIIMDPARKTTDSFSSGAKTTPTPGTSDSLSGEAKTTPTPGTTDSFSGEAKISPAPGSSTVFPNGKLCQTKLKAAGHHFLKLIRKAGIPAALFVLILIGINFIHSRAESSPEWKSYFAFNDARENYLDSPEVSYDTFPGEFAEAGLTPEGWLLLHRWTFTEQESFSAETLQAFADITSRAYTKRYRLHSLIDTFKSSPNYFLVLIPGLILLLLILTDKKYHRRTGVFTYLMLLLLFVFLAAIRLRFLLRVGVPLAIVDIIFLFLCSENDQSEPPIAQSGARKVTFSRIAALIVFAALLISLGFFFKGYQRSVSSLRSKTTAAGYKKLRKEIEKHPDRVYIVESPIYVHLFAWGHTVDEIQPTDIFSHVIRPGSWDNFSPRYFEIAEKCGIRDPNNLLSSMIDDEHVFFVSEDVNYVLNFLNAEGKGPVLIAGKKQKGPASIVRLVHDDGSSP